MGFQVEHLLNTIHQADISLFFLINHARSPFLDKLMVKVSDFGLFAPLIAAFIAYRLFKGTNRERFMWVVGIIAVISSDALCARLLKPLVGRLRPYMCLDNVFVYKSGKWIVTSPGFRATLKASLSWPSCHATNMWTAAFFLWGWKRAYGILLFLLATLVSYSRIYLGVHYPLDCLGGALVGLVWGTMLVLIAKKMIEIFSW